MEFPLEFHPPRGRGYFLFIGAMLLLLGLSGFLLLFALDQQNSGYLAIILLGAVILFIPVPFILYSVYSLQRARYILDRDGLRLVWGLRIEDIPLTEIEWVRMASELEYSLTYPISSFTGILRGISHSPDLGDIEFMATDIKRLLLVATTKKVFAISPARHIDFLKGFQNAFELGSISPLEAKSSQAVNFLSNVLADRRARLMIFIGIALTILLLVTVGLIIPTRQTVLFGNQLTASSSTDSPPSDRLLLLPVLALFALAFDLIFGFYLFSRKDKRAQAFMVLASSILTTLLLLLALLFIH